ncbi:MAG: oxamate carbamoyltransferase subunit AllG family protein [Candidatus Hodarchaeales archaeon]
MPLKELFKSELKVINVGLSSFKDTLVSSGVECVQVDWKPPAGGNKEALDALSKLSEKSNAITEANMKAIEIINKGKPVLIGLDTAIKVIPGMKKNLILHAGPPVTWERMCGPMKGAIMGALIYEGLAKSPEEAEKLAASGDIEYSPCHEHSTVGPMAGIVSASMPVFILENKEYGNKAYCTMNEGLGKVLRYGAYSEEVIEKLKWMEKVLYPVLKKAVEKLGKIDLKNIIAQALHMGDEVHNRNRAATSLFFRIIAPAIVETTGDAGTVKKVLEFIHGNDHFFLNLSMPASKATLDAARNIENSSIVVAMTRNGTDFGLQLSGTGDRWFTGKAPLPDALFFPGFTKDDANPDIGDSSITETNALGGFAIAASPAIVQFVGGSSLDAINYTLEMYEITAGENSVFQIPYLNFRGTPTGIDVIKVVEKGITPFIDTGVAHKDPGIGQVGAGVLSAPMEPFIKALFGLV